MPNPHIFLPFFLLALVKNSKKGSGIQSSLFCVESWNSNLFCKILIKRGNRSWQIGGMVLRL